jgi:hypothetical protein
MSTSIDIWRSGTPRSRRTTRAPRARRKRPGARARSHRRAPPEATPARVPRWATACEAASVAVPATAATMVRAARLVLCPVRYRGRRPWTDCPACPRPAEYDSCRDPGRRPGDVAWGQPCLGARGARSGRAARSRTRSGRNPSRLRGWRRPRAAPRGVIPTTTASSAICASKRHGAASRLACAPAARPRDAYKRLPDTLGARAGSVRVRLRLRPPRPSRCRRDA